jgi:hypothetical protein
MDSSLFAVLDILMEQRAQLDVRILEIIDKIRRASADTTGTAPNSPAAQTRSGQSAPRKKRRLSAAGRKAISDALRKRHAERKKAQQLGSSSPAKKAAAKKT